MQFITERKQSFQDGIQKQASLSSQVLAEVVALETQRKKTSKKF